MAQELTSNCLLTQQPENFAVSFLLQIINGTSDPIFVKDRQHRWILLNDAFCNFIGRQREELIGKSDYDFFPKAEADVFWERDELVFTTGVTDENEETCTDAEGITHYISTKKCLFEDSTGNKFLVGTIRDITQSIIKYKQLETKLQKLWANVPGMLYQFILKPDGSVSFPYVSSGSYELYGLAPEAIQNDASLIVSIVHPEDNREFEESIAISAQTLQPWQWEGRIVLPTGQVKWLQATSRPELQADGSIIWDGLITNISKIKQVEEALQQAYAELEIRVEARTQELALSNQALQAEIAQRQQKQAELKASQQRLALLIQQTPVGVIEWNTKFEITAWNPAAERIFGYQASEVIGNSFDFIVPENNRANVSQLVAALLSQKEEIWNINENLTKDNRIIICEWYNSPLVAENGELIAVASLVFDITERQQTEKSLMLYKQAVESSSDAIAIADADGYHIYQNAAFSKLYECETVEDFIKFGGVFTAITDPVVAQKMWQTTIAGESWIGEIEQQSASGRIIQTFLRSYALKDTSGNKIGFVGAITDISERKRSEALLRQQEQFLRTVYEGSEHLIFVVDIIDDCEFCYTGWNPATERATSLSRNKVIGKSPEDVHGAVEGAKIRQDYARCLKAGTPMSYEECLTFQDEETWWLTTLNPLKDSEGKIYRLVGTTFNISDRKRAEIQLQQQTKELENTLQELQYAQMQLVQSEKMSSLGQLVAGVAHEINNPVNFIYANIIHAHNYSQDLLELVKIYQQHYPKPINEIEEFATEIDLEFLSQDLPKLLNSIKVGAQRIREIVISLRTFSRMDEADMKEVDIHQGIDSTLMILEHRIKAKPDRPAINIIKKYTKLPLIQCYAGKLNQVFMNILANAIDAVEDSLASGISSVVNPEAIKIATNPQIIISTQLLKSSHVKISIADNGPGISEEVKKKLFDPFFTTKPIGKGTGIGLSISYQIIVQKHGGSLECFSQPGQGTEFVITIPLSQG